MGAIERSRFSNALRTKTLQQAMTPTLPLILLTAIFWTLPASVAVLLYRTHGSSLEKLRRSIEGTLGLPQPHDA